MCDFFQKTEKRSAQSFNFFAEKSRPNFRRFTGKPAATQTLGKV